MHCMLETLDNHFEKQYLVYIWRFLEPVWFSSVKASHLITKRCAFLVYLVLFIYRVLILALHVILTALTKKRCILGVRRHLPAQGKSALQTPHIGSVHWPKHPCIEIQTPGCTGF